MCDPVTIGLAAGGLFLDQMNRNKVERKQTKVRTAELARQQAIDDKARDRLVLTQEQFQPDAREQRNDEAAAVLEAALMQPLQEPGVMSQAAGAMPGGKVSEDFLTARAAEEADAMDRTLKIAKLMSRIDAAGQQRFGEGVELSRSAEDLANLGTGAQRSARVSGLELEEASRSNPLLSTLAGTMQAAAAAGVGSGTFGATPAGATGSTPVTMKRLPHQRPIHMDPLT